jgi:hypothetical protein
MTALSAALTENNITAHGTPEEAAATAVTPFDSFASQKELTELAAGWPAKRMVAIWNSLPGVNPVKKFKDPTTPAIRISPRGRKPHLRPKVSYSGQGRARNRQGEQEGHRRQERAPRQNRPARRKKPARRAREVRRPQMVAMLPRKNGATLAKIMEKMGWQEHTVRSFMAGAMKKAGFHRESFKPEGRGAHLPHH